MVSRTFIIAELAECSPIIIQLAVTHQAEKIWLYDRTTVQGAIFNMRGQLCHKHAKLPQLCSVVQWSVHWAPSWTTQVLVLAGARCCALEMCGEKKMRAPLLGLAKSMY